MICKFLWFWWLVYILTSDVHKKLFFNSQEFLPNESVFIINNWQNLNILMPKNSLKKSKYFEIVMYKENDNIQVIWW